jgi:hypothetical protein
MTMTVAEANSLANKYAADCPWGALFVTDPGNTGSNTGEVSGGSYARVALTWTTAVNGQILATATFNVPAGAVTFAAVCTSNSGATVRQTVAVGPRNFSSNTTYVVNFTYTQS